MHPLNPPPPPPRCAHSGRAHRCSPPPCAHQPPAPCGPPCPRPLPQPARRPPNPPTNEPRTLLLSFPNTPHALATHKKSFVAPLRFSPCHIQQQPKLPVFLPPCFLSLVGPVHPAHPSIHPSSSPPVPFRSPPRLRQQQPQARPGHPLLHPSLPIASISLCFDRSPATSASRHPPALPCCSHCPAHCGPANTHPSSHLTSPRQPQPSPEVLNQSPESALTQNCPPHAPPCVVHNVCRHFAA